MNFMRFGVFWILGLAAGLALAADVKVVEEIVAKVNGDIVTRGELDRSRLALANMAKMEGVPPEKLADMLKERQKNILRDQIDQLLLVQRGKELNINVDPEVTKQLADIQLRSKITDPDKFQQFIREQLGMLYEDYKAQLKNELLTRRVIGMEVGSRISVPQTEIQKYYDEHKADFVRQEEVFLREILISSEGKDAAGVAVVEKKAKAIVERARKGEKFPELARDNSDAESKQRMGEIGWFKRSDLNPQLADVVFKQRKGYVTDAIRLPNGFLILRVEDRHEAGQAAIDDVRDEIMEKLYVPRMEPAVRTFLTKLREDAFLEIRAGYVDSGAAPGKDTAWKDPAQLKPETTTKKAVEMRRKKKLLWTVPLPGKPKVVQTTG